MCERGVNGRIDKGRRVLAGGAAGMILYNPINQDVESDNHYLPAIHVNGPDNDLLAFVNGHTNVHGDVGAGHGSSRAWPTRWHRSRPADRSATGSSPTSRRPASRCWRE